MLRNPETFRQLLAVNFDQKPELANFLLRGITFMLEYQKYIRTEILDEESKENDEEEYIDFLERE